MRLSTILRSFGRGSINGLSTLLFLLPIFLSFELGLFAFTVGSWGGMLWFFCAIMLAYILSPIVVFLVIVLGASLLIRLIDRATSLTTSLWLDKLWDQAIAFGIWLEEAVFPDEKKPSKRLVDLCMVAGCCFGPLVIIWLAPAQIHAASWATTLLFGIILTLYVRLLSDLTNKLKARWFPESGAEVIVAQVPADDNSEASGG